ncbi:condensin-2 complex subunit D3 isoform X2 [Antennarius striatus]|uniref:condensin-2 complex subunit D3 isoform X2 n=1 Tax=Antennarius striatus TaxID=241820 RepID=UPI0035B2349D
MDLIGALRLLRLDRIPQAWVDVVWSLEFTETEPLDGSVDDELSAGGATAFRALHQSLLGYAAGRAGSQGVWAVLGEHGVSIRSLVALLSYFVLRAKAKGADVPQRVMGLNAAAVYLLLLAIPGSIASRAFHQVLLDTCADLTSHCWPQEPGKKRKKDVLKSSAGKRSKPQQKDSPEVDVDEEEEEEEEEEVCFSDQDLVKLRDAVVVLVQSLLRLLQMLSLKDTPQSASSCTQVFIRLLYFEPVSGQLVFTAGRDVTTLRSIPEMALHGLELLCSARHGDQTESLRRVFHQLLYVILMMKRSSQGGPSLLAPSQATLSTRDQAIHFICHLVEEQKELAAPLLQVLLQRLCVQMVERSEFRSHGAQSVGLLTSQMEGGDYACFTRWLWRFSRSSKMVHRLFSVDVVMVLLEQPERHWGERPDPELAHFLPHRFLIQNVLFARRGDASPTVRGHVLACLAQCLELPSLNVTQAVHNLFSATGAQTELEGDTTAGAASSQRTYSTLPFRTVELSTTHGASCDVKENLALVLRRVGDSSTNVRKSALQALVGLLKHDVIPLSPENLERLWERSRDLAVSVKKKALQCVGELLAVKPGCSAVQEAWLRGVLPAVVDAEGSVQEKALEALDQVLLQQLTPYSRGRHLDASQQLTWDLLGLLCHQCQDLSRYFSRAFTIWTNQKRFSAAFVSSLLSHTEVPHADGAWLLLSKVAASASPLSPLSCEKILDAWDHMISSGGVSVTTCCHVLSVVGDVASGLDGDTRGRLVRDLMSWLRSFSLPLELISAAVETLHQIGSSEDLKQTQAFLEQHCGELVSTSEDFLSRILLNQDGAQNLNQDLMVRHLHTLGVASLQCPARVSRRTRLLVESILTTHSDQLSGNQEELPASLPVTQFKTNSLPTKVRAHGVITLGKLCLQHEDLAQRFLPVLARELEVGSEVAVRNNVVVIMCDLCVRYTNMVDHYIPNISACLGDAEAIIRENALIMLTNLLQEEYVKWKGSLFFRFLVALVDPVPSISSLCEYCLLHVLLKTNPPVFSQNFIECIFYFNAYDRHPSYNRFPQSHRVKAGLSLRGALHADKRFRIYRFLLKHMTDAQRFSVTHRISQTVLTCFADEELPLDEGGAELLSETFRVLSLEEMKLRVMCAAGAEPEEDNAVAMATAVKQAAHRKVVTQVHRRVFLENTVPLIISLKNLLEQRRSPVLRDLMNYLQVTMQDFRSEVKKFFSGDEQLAVEVEFTLKEKEREEEGQSLTDGGSRPRLRLGVATPQQRPPTPPSARLAGTDSVFSRVQRSRVPVFPKGAAPNRAMSTPKGLGVNVSFDEGLSAIFSDRGTSPTQNTSDVQVQPGERTSGRRRWNVQSPLRHRK